MGCGTSSHVVAPAPAEQANGHKPSNGVNGVNGNANPHDDGLPTVVLTDTPVKNKPAISFEIPLEEFDPNPRPTTPPVHLQRLLEAPQVEISLTDIEEKLAEAEQRRLAILQQRAASAHKKSQKMTKDYRHIKAFEAEYDENKHGTLLVPADPGLEDKYI